MKSGSNVTTPSSASETIANRCQKGRELTFSDCWNFFDCCHARRRLSIDGKLKIFWAAIFTHRSHHPVTTWAVPRSASPAQEVYVLQCTAIHNHMPQPEVKLRHVCFCSVFLTLDRACCREMEVEMPADETELRSIDEDLDKPESQSAVRLTYDEAVENYGTGRYQLLICGQFYHLAPCSSHAGSSVATRMGWVGDGMGWVGDGWGMGWDGWSKVSFNFFHFKIY